MITSVSRRLSFVGWARYWLFDRHYNMTVRVLLVGICFGFTLLTALLSRDIDFNSFSSVIKSVILIALLLGVTTALLMYRNMQGTALFVLFLSTLVNDGISTGTGTKLTFTFLTLLLWVIVWLFKKVIVDRKFDVLPALPNWPIVFFCITVIISYIWSGAYVELGASYLFSQKSLVRLMTAAVLIISPLTYLLFSNAIRTKRAFQLITWWFIGIGIVMGLMRLGLGSVLSPLNARGQYPTWLIVLALGQCMFNKELSWKIKVGLLVIVAMWVQITFGLGLGWLSGWLPIVVVLIALLVFYSRKLLIVLCLGVVVWGLLNADFINHTFGKEQSESGSTRSIAWSRVLGVVGKHFLFGAGPAGYEFYFHAYGYYDSGVGTADLSHNNYLDIIAQTGVVGFALWILLWAGQGVMVLRLLRKRIDDPFLSALRYSLAAGYPAILLAMMLGDWITPFPYTQTLVGIDYTIWAWMFSGLVVALYYWSPNTAEAAVQLPPNQSVPTLSEVLQRESL